MNPYQPSAVVEPELPGTEAAPTSPTTFRPLTPWAQAAFVYAGIIVPLASHALSAAGLPDQPSWQTGDLSDKLAFVLTPQAGFVFYPLMAYAVIALTLYLIHDSKRRVAYWVQLGIFGGVPVALWYSVMLDLTMIESVGDIGLVALQFGVPLAIYLVLRFLKWLHRKTIIPIGWYVIAVIGIGGLLVGCVVNGPAILVEVMFGGPLVLSLVCGPVWAFLVYSHASLRLLNDRRSPAPLLDGPKKLSGLAYFAYVIAACPISVKLSLSQYSSLPTQPVNTCYVVTAAARGHRRWVGSTIERIDGCDRLVNRQLKRLWALERMLIQISPSGHRVLRQVYDRLGPHLASRISNPWLADLAYLSLKPLEWTAAAIVWGSRAKNKTAFAHRETSPVTP